MLFSVITASKHVENYKIKEQSWKLGDSWIVSEVTKANNRPPLNPHGWQRAKYSHRRKRNCDWQKLDRT